MKGAEIFFPTGNRWGRGPSGLFPPERQMKIEALDVTGCDMGARLAVFGPEGNSVG